MRIRCVTPTLTPSAPHIKSARVPRALQVLRVIEGSRLHEVPPLPTQLDSCGPVTEVPGLQNQLNEDCYHVVVISLVQASTLA